MKAQLRYEFTARVWRHASAAGWYFISLPQELSAEIRQYHQWQEQGWGRLKVTARTGAAEWDTSIWFDTAHNTYLLPLKAAIRKREKIEHDTLLDVHLSI